MLLGAIAGVILGFILSFFNVDAWLMVNVFPDFLAQFGTIIYYAFFAALGGLIGYYGKH